MKDFFADPKFQAELQLAATAARQHLRTIQPPPRVGLGDSFLFAEAGLPVRWVAIAEHKSIPELWYLIAADELSLIGTTDIELPEANPLAPLVLRCGVGVWAHSRDLGPERYVGCLDGEAVADAQDRLSEMEHNEVPITEIATAAQADEEYRDWIAVLARMVKQIELRIHQEPVVLPSQATKSSCPDLAIVAEQPRVYVTEAAEAAARHFASSPEHVVLTGAFPGKLVVRQLANVYELRYFPAIHPDSPPDSPPPLMQASGIDVRDGNWDWQTSGDWRWSQLLMSVNGTLSLVIGNETFEIPHF